MHGNSKVSLLFVGAALLLMVTGLRAEPVPVPHHTIPGDQKVVQVRLLPGHPADLDAQAVSAAFRHAVAVWNTALGGDPRLVITPASAPPPPGELCLQIGFSAEPVIFAKKGADGDFANTYTVVDTAKNIATTTIAINNTPTFAARESFSTDGRPSIFYDLELVAMHEIGHALGLGHDAASPHVPPIMSAHIASNNELHQATHLDIAALRHLYPEDLALLATAQQDRQATRVVGAYSGSLTVTKVEAGSPIPVGHVSQIPKGQFTIVNEKGVLKLDFHGGTGQAPAVALSKGLPLTFSNFQGDYLHSATLTKITATGLEVHLVVTPLNHRIEQDAVLTRDH